MILKLPSPLPSGLLLRFSSAEHVGGAPEQHPARPAGRRPPADRDPSAVAAVHVELAVPDIGDLGASAVIEDQDVAGADLARLHGLGIGARVADPAAVIDADDFGPGGLYGMI